MEVQMTTPQRSTHTLGLRVGSMRGSGRGGGAVGPRVHTEHTPGDKRVVHQSDLFRRGSSHGKAETHCVPGQEGGGGWHKASVFGCLPVAAPMGLAPLLILTLCGSERVLVVSTEPLDNLSCVTTPGSAVPETGCCPCR